MTGFDPGIHAVPGVTSAGDRSCQRTLERNASSGVGGRVKPGHDVGAEGVYAPFIAWRSVADGSSSRRGSTFRLMVARFWAS